LSQDWACIFAPSRKTFAPCKNDRCFTCSAVILTIVIIWWYSNSFVVWVYNRRLFMWVASNLSTLFVIYLLTKIWLK
jgi:hypothetical protein